MPKRIAYDFNPEAVPNKVLLIWPINTAKFLVYCPPIDGELPWIEQFENIADATAVAEQLAQRIGQKMVLFTRDKTPWWLTGLTARA